MKRLATVLSTVFLLSTAIAFLYMRQSPGRQKVEGRTMAEWLQLLSTKSNALSESPLKIQQIFRQPGVIYFEFPLSYDSLRKYGFADPAGSAAFGIIVNGRALSGGAVQRAIDGNSFLTCGASNFQSGSNQVSIEFQIFDARNKDRIFRAIGPTTNFYLAAQN